LLFADLGRLSEVVSRSGALQVIYAGKAHPRDTEGKQLIQRIFRAAEQLKDRVTVVYLEDYGLELGKLMTAGVDVWLNTPQPPLEASGTSGMKGATNGVPSLSILDGWWIEGWIEDVTGWAIDEHRDQRAGVGSWQGDARMLYDKLEGAVMPTFYQDRPRFIDMMVHSIALNGSFFNTHRMVQQYVTKAYFD
jgi:glycogen phosphorylase